MSKWKCTSCLYKQGPPAQRKKRNGNEGAPWPRSEPRTPQVLVWMDAGMSTEKEPPVLVWDAEKDPRMLGSVWTPRMGPRRWYEMPRKIPGTSVTTPNTRRQWELYPRHIYVRFRRQKTDSLREKIALEVLNWGRRMSLRVPVRIVEVTTRIWPWQSMAVDRSARTREGPKICHLGKDVHNFFPSD